jgi:predicted DNA-binding transcriptional regulator AlpA
MGKSIAACKYLVLTPIIPLNFVLRLTITLKRCIYRAVYFHIYGVGAVANKTAAKRDWILPEAFRNRAILRPNEVFEVLGVKPSLGWKLINHGPLVKVRLGARSVGVTCASVERLILSGARTPGPIQDGGNGDE